MHNRCDTLRKKSCQSPTLSVSCVCIPIRESSSPFGVTKYFVALYISGLNTKKNRTERRLQCETTASIDTHHFSFRHLIRSRSVAAAAVARCSCVHEHCVVSCMKTLSQVNICHSLLGLIIKHTHFRVALLQLSLAKQFRIQSDRKIKLLKFII